MESAIAAIATLAHGVVTRRQLLRAGISRRQIQRRLQSGLLIRVHDGVYRFGHASPSIEARYMAAVCAGGDDAMLCGRAAAHLYRLRRGPAPPPEVTTGTYRRIEGVRTRRLRIDPRDATVWRGIPVTTVPRVLVDLAGVLVVDDLALACHEASIRYGTKPAAVEAVLARWSNAPGAGQLRSVLRGEVRVTLSRLEKRFLELLEQAGLPLPEMNRPAGRRRVDCRWPKLGLTIELDSYRYHSSRHAWEQDRRREREARARGDAFRRYTYGDVFERPQPLLTELRRLMQRRAAMAPIWGD